LFVLIDLFIIFVYVKQQNDRKHENSND
jgi:hypothetical protein